MNELLNTRFFNLLVELSQEVTDKEMQNAYAQFTVHMDALSNSDDKQIILRTLNITRVELVFIETLYRHEQGGKCPEISLSSKDFRPYQF